MAEVEITQEEVRGIDINQVASMQLKDGTVVVVQGEGEGQYEEGGYEEQYYNEEGEEYQDQSNQLRARPMMGRMVVQPKPMPPKMVRPLGPVKPMVVPRGPVRPGVPMGYGMPFRARPGMPPQRPHVVAKPMVVPARPGMPKPVPVTRPAVVPKPGYPVKPVGVPARPMVPGQRPLVNQMVQAPGFAFRARPGELEEDDYPEEEYAEEGYCECDEEALEEGAETQFRARPVFAPVGAPRPPMVMKPKVVAVPVVGPKPVMVPKRGPAPRPGYNTFQPRGFRARPRPVKPMHVAPPMGTFKPAPYGMPPKVVRPVPGPAPRKAYGFGQVFRSRPRSASYDAYEYADENEYQYTEGCESSVCTKCGKEF